MKFGTLLLSLIALSGGAYSNFTKEKQTPCRARRNLQNESFLY